MGRFGSLAVALAAGAVMLFGPSGVHRPPAPPAPATAVWPAAQRATLPARLPDGTAYEPGLFLDARQSVGTAPTRDGKFLRLVVRHADGSLRLLRRLPMAGNPSFESPTAAGRVLVWAETLRNVSQLWTADLGAGRPPHRLTGDVGDMRFYQSQYDLEVAQQRVHWVAAAANDVTEVRSVALAGGRVDVKPEPGTWSLSAWPWLLDGATDAGGTTRLRNVVTGQDRPIPATRRGVTGCGPTWCQVVTLNGDGYPRLDLMRPDGSDRRKVAEGTASTVINDVGVLDKFEVFAQVTPSSALTGNVQLLLYEIATRRTAEISPDAGAVLYNSGVLSWSTGNQDNFLRHTLDLRTL